MYKADWMSRGDVMPAVSTATLTLIHITVKNPSGLFADLSISSIMFENELGFKPTTSK